MPSSYFSYFVSDIVDMNDTAGSKALCSKTRQASSYRKDSRHAHTRCRPKLLAENKIAELKDSFAIESDIATLPADRINKLRAMLESNMKQPAGFQTLNEQINKIVRAK